MLSDISRWLVYLNVVLYAVLGTLLFFLPEQLAPVFAWSVTPFMTMTIGGWCLGNAWLAWIVARRWSWRLVYPALLYLWLFGIGELLVLSAFRDRVVLVHPIAWLYLITLFVTVITALVGLVDWIRIRPAIEPPARAMRTQHRLGAILFVLFVGFLGLYGLTAPIGAPGTNGGIFPEIMSPFTLRSFGMFYLALALSAIPFLWNKNLDALLTYGLAAYGLIVFITSAGFVYIRLFDFVARPGGLAYFGAYLAVGIYFLFMFRSHGTGAARAA
ncbi:MAG TPA: hypothetical protein VFO91_14565 [Anaerolineales bacterium]|nr:hypothetical protein [Anaerolineales bacterium]